MLTSLFSLFYTPLVSVAGSYTEDKPETLAYYTSPHNNIVYQF